MNESKARELRQAARRYVREVGGGIENQYTHQFTRMVYRQMKKEFKRIKRAGGI